MGDIIVWIVSAIAEIIGENYFIRKQKEIDEKNRLIFNGNCLTLPKYMKTIGLMSLFIWTVLAVFATIILNVNMWVRLFFVSFMLFSILILWSYAVQRHKFDDSGIYYKTMWKQTKRFLYCDIVAVDYSVSLQYFSFKMRSGEKFYIAHNVLGFAYFAEKLLANAPVSALNRCRHVFQKWANNKPKIN